MYIGIKQRDENVKLPQFSIPDFHITRFFFKTFVDSVQNVCAIFVSNSFNSVAPRDRRVPSPTPSSLVREVIRLARTFCS